MDLAISELVPTTDRQQACGLRRSEAGSIPADWDAVYVEDIAMITTGSRNTQDLVKGGAYPFFVRALHGTRLTRIRGAERAFGGMFLSTL